MINNENNQGVTETPSYIIVKVDYKCKLIMPYAEGMEFLRIWSSATEMDQEYASQPIKIKAVDREFEIKFMSEEQFKEMKMAAVIGAAPEDD